MKRRHRDSREVEGNCITECVSRGSNGTREGEKGGKPRD